jgi:16S rRNA (guanine966-N2)-methyltransferase
VRVTGGTARGRRLDAPPGIRPTADRVREAIFNVLDAQQDDYVRVLDLYAGSGALGIEALSRGDGWCDFVERDAKAAEAIKTNIAALGFGGRARVHPIAVERAPERLDGVYSLVLADPPYDDGDAIAAVGRIAQSQLVGPDTVIVLEHSRRGAAVDALGAHTLAWTRSYGDTQVSIYREDADGDREPKASQGGSR